MLCNIVCINDPAQIKTINFFFQTKTSQEQFMYK